MIELLRRASSGSVSKTDEPSSTRPMRFTAPAANSSASATVVFPPPALPHDGDVADLRDIVSWHHVLRCVRR